MCLSVFVCVAINSCVFLHYMYSIYVYAWNSDKRGAGQCLLPLPNDYTTNRAPMIVGSHQGWAHNYNNYRLQNHSSVNVFVAYNHFKIHVWRFISLFVLDDHLPLPIICLCNFCIMKINNCGRIIIPNSYSTGRCGVHCSCFCWRFSLTSTNNSRLC